MRSAITRRSALKTAALATTAVLIPIASLPGSLALSVRSQHKAGKMAWMDVRDKIEKGPRSVFGRGQACALWQWPRRKLRPLFCQTGLILKCIPTDMRRW